MIPRYHINIFWSDKGQCWIADVPDLPGCQTRGGSALDAVVSVQQAMIDWAATARDGGRPLPQPSYQAEPA